MHIHIYTFIDSYTRSEKKLSFKRVDGNEKSCYLISVLLINLRQMT